MKFIKFLSLIFCFYILFQYVPSVYATETIKEPTTLAEALKVYSTPFIDDYRARYAVNNFAKRQVITMAFANCIRHGIDSKFHITCTQQDIENIQKLTKYRDNASLALASHIVKGFDFMYAVESGEVDSLVDYGYEIAEKDFELGKIYIDQAIDSGYLFAYTVKANLYYDNKMFDEYCSIMEEGYEKIGFKFIGLALLNKNKRETDESKHTSYSKVCLRKTPENFFNEVNSYEAYLYKAYQYVYDKEYVKAKNLFQEIYDKSDNNVVKQNAGFCLGAMYYLGITVKENKEYGLKLMKHAVDEGYTVFIAEIPKIQMLPRKYEIINMDGATCESLFFN